MREFYYDYENPNDDVGHWEEEIKTVVTNKQMEQEEEIKTVVTNKQMEQMAYNVGE